MDPILDPGHFLITHTKTWVRSRHDSRKLRDHSMFVFTIYQLNHYEFQGLA